MKYTSIVALTSIGYLVILVVAHFIKGDTMADGGPIHFIEWQGLISALSVFPVIVFAYTCHQNVRWEKKKKPVSCRANFHTNARIFHADVLDS